MMTRQEKLEAIFSSLINGQRTQMVEQIDEYLPADFFPDLFDFLKESFSDDLALHYFADAANSYFRIKSVQGK